MNTTLRRTVTSVVVSAVFAAIVPAPASAGEFSGVLALTDRERVELRLAENGVDRPEAKLRAAALTDDEAKSVANEIDALPAGGMADPVSLSIYGTILVGMIVVAAVALVVIAVRKAAGATKSHSQGDTAGSDPAGGEPVRF